MTMIQESRQRHEFRAMGSAVEVEVIDGDEHHLAYAQRRLHFLEQRWSRFIESSDISRLNAARGAPVEVDAATVTLLESMVHGRHATDGAFDPTVLPTVIGLGYGASRHDPTARVDLDPAVQPVGHLEGIEVLRSAEDETGRPVGPSIARLPTGMALDPGGIGKGLAADLVAHELLRAGAAGAMVSVGGDVRVAGRGPNNGDWVIAILSDHDTSHPPDMKPQSGLCVSRHVVDHVRLADGGVATSGTIHHQVDPTAGTRAAARWDGVPLAQASIVGGSAMWAEVCATWAMVRGPLVLDDLEQLSLGARLQFVDGTVLETPSWSRFSTQTAQAVCAAGEGGTA